MAFADGAGVGLFLAAEQADEGRFAGAVSADQGDALAALDLEGEVFEDLLGPGRLPIDGRHGIAFAKVGDLHHGAAGGRRLRDGEVNGRFLFRDLDALDLSSSLMRDCTCLALVAW